MHIAGPSYPQKLAAFRELKGWDSRAKAIVAEAKSRCPDEQVDELKAVLKEAESPAKRRHEVAHGVWALIDERPDALVLIPAGVYTQMAIIAVEAAQRETTQFRIDNSAIISQGRIVTMAHLQALYGELTQARELISAYTLSHFPAFADVTGRDFADQAAHVSGHKGVSKRVAASARGRRRARKRSAD